MKKQFLFIIFNLLTIFSYAQYEYSQWLFGYNAGIDFSHKNVLPILLDTTQGMKAWEGTSSYSSKEGNLIIYTNGINIWNKNHQILNIDNPLYGSKSSTNGSLIIPIKNSSKLIIFTVPDFDFGFIENNCSMRYSIFDTSDNSISNINTVLIDTSTEKLCAYQLKDGTYWVCAIQWNSNNFHLFKIDERGISNHLIQSVGRIHKKFEIGYAESAGQMCFSSTGDHLGYANNDSRTYSIMSFDTLSGNIEEIITDSISKIPKKYTWNFGCAFSSDGTKFYFNSGYINHTDIYQIDLTDNNLEKIQQLDESTFSMQIGPNGKIYISSALQYNFERWNCVHTIENPNGKGIYAKFKQYGQVVGKSTIGTGIYNYPQTQIPIIKESESIVEEKEFFIPNSFSPNGDGTNDTFNPSRTYKGDITKYFIRIYNRLGNIIYEESNPNNIGWNGLDKMGMKECPLDTYYYYVQINEKVYKGDIILLR